MYIKFYVQDAVNLVIFSGKKIRKNKDNFLQRLIVPNPIAYNNNTVNSTRIVWIFFHKGNFYNNHVQM